ncbi:MAG: LysR family transcriptional regulator [Reichenbachiella sp.]|uniref:LysR family transcriptional regulator n=1 Tax=Reichenbachiella sp. TaxID=2184521 RepID=UPI003263FBA7
MEIKYLKLIQTIADEGNISNSADRLFLTQSALSHQLKEIEERLGFKIFIRSRNNWKLTGEGIELYKLSQTVLNEIEERLLKIKDIREGSRGTIRISTECYSFYHGLPKFIQKMGLLYPQINIHMIVEATHHPVSKLLSNEIDIALVTTKPENSRLKTIELFEDEVYAIMHPENLLADKKYLEAQDFTHQHLIIHSFPLETVSVYNLFLRPHKVESEKVTAIPLTEVALELVQTNMGITCLPRWTLKSFKLPHHLAFKPLGPNGLKRKHYLVYRSEDASKKYFLDFIDNVRDEFSI